MRATQSTAFDPCHWSIRTIIGIGLATAWVVASGCQKAAPPAAKPPPPTVFFAIPVEQSVQEIEEFTGRTAAVMDVEVRARVSGYLDKVLFEDGADVKAGEPLFVIDDRIYQAEVARAALAAAKDRKSVVYGKSV